jgi:DNA-directed RNA polymerase I subunit RPA2
MRPVTNLRSKSREMIGSFEQVYMEIALSPDEFTPNVTTHVEENKSNFLSIIASFTPFSDFNQSPRNMYQVDETAQMRAQLQQILTTSPL